LSTLPSLQITCHWSLASGIFSMQLKMAPNPIPALYGFSLKGCPFNFSSSEKELVKVG
jgi:hypothetical protein